jgi:hypothetical protein
MFLSALLFATRTCRGLACAPAAQGRRPYAPPASLPLPQQGSSCRLLVVSAAKYTSCKDAGTRGEGLRKLAWPAATAVLLLCCCKRQTHRRAQLQGASESAVPAATVCSQIQRTCTATAAGYEEGTKP